MNTCVVGDIIYKKMMVCVYHEIQMWCILPSVHYGKGQLVPMYWYSVFLLVCLKEGGLPCLTVIIYMYYVHFIVFMSMKDVWHLQH